MATPPPAARILARSAALAFLALVAVDEAAGREREFFRSYADALAALQAKDCARALTLLEQAIAQEPAEAARKRTYGMNVIEYYPHLYRARALACLARTEEARASLAASEKQGACPPAEIAATRAALGGGAAPSGEATVALLHDGSPASHQPLIDGFTAACRGRVTLHAAGAAGAAAAVRASRPAVLVTLGEGARRIGVADLADLPQVVAGLACRRPGNGERGVGVPESPFVQDLAVLRRLLPKMKVVGVLHDPTGCGASLDPLVAEAATLGIKLRVVAAATMKDIPPALRSLLAEKPDVIMPLGFEGASADTLKYIVATGLERGIPAVARDTGLVRVGALASLLPSPAEAGRRAAELANDILAGKAPAVDGAPVPTAVALNLKVAKSLGVEIPQDIVDGAMLVVR